MACLGTAYIAICSQVRIEPPEPKSCRPQPYYPAALPSSNSGLLESSKRDMHRLFRLPDW